MKDISNMTYSDFCTELDNGDWENYELILEYNEFEVWLDTSDGKYYYLETGENDASDFFELKCIASLTYDAIHDLLPTVETGVGKIMSALFDCCCCGEAVFDDCIKYLWFEMV